jgi:hypothetical protein
MTVTVTILLELLAVGRAQLISHESYTLLLHWMHPSQVRKNYGKANHGRIPRARRSLHE